MLGSTTVSEMMNMRGAFVTIDGAKVFRSYVSAWKGGKGIGVKYCAICEKEVKVGEEVSLLMCNNTLFPNVWVHDEHLDFGGEDWEDIAQHNVVQTIVNKYRRFEECYKMRKIWGDS